MMLDISLVILLWNDMVEVLPAALTPDSQCHTSDLDSHAAEEDPCKRREHNKKPLS
jgi:hypothetical protein